MKKILLILSALLLTAVGASAQDVTTAYTFNAKDWVSIDATRVTNDNISYDEDANTITVKASGTNNVALANGSAYEGPFSTSSYTVTNEQYWFIVVGTNLSTEDDASDLWWMNGANHNTNVVPTNVVELEDGKVLLAWDLVLSGIDTNLQDEMNYLDGWTGFGLTSTTGESVISDICFYTTEEAVKAYPSLEGVLQEATPYEFVCTDWVSLDTGRVTNENITYDETSNTITVNAGTGANNVALGNSTSSSNNGPFTTANYYVTNDQCWFVVVGTNLATGKTVTNDACDSYLWWMDGANYGQWAPTEVAAGDDGTVVIAWDLSTMTEIDVNLQDEVNLLSGWTGFGLTSTTGTSVISDINFYTYDEMIEAYPGLDQRAPYTFVCTDWVGVSGRSADDGQVTYSGNTITVNATGNNNIALFNGSGENSVNTTNYYITSDQKYFVVVGSNLNTSNTDNTYSQLWWMNGVGGPSAAPDNVVELATTGEILFAWDLTAITEFSTVLTPDADGKIYLTGWTGFGLTSTTGTSVISYIGFYTDTQLDAASNGVEWTMTDAGWGTLILPFDAEIPTVTDENEEATLTLYAGSALSLGSDGTTITVSETSETIAANTPYLVSGTAGTYSFTGTPINEAGTYTVGMLVGTLVNMTQDDFTADGTEYVLQNHEEAEDGEEGEGLAFYPITSESSDVTLDAYHCYLTLDNSTSPDGVRAFISLPGSDNEETGIVAVESETLANDAIYDLSGRRVSKAVKGVYIQNGKKVLVK